jgi:hypothetical protein
MLSRERGGCDAVGWSCCRVCLRRVHAFFLFVYWNLLYSLYSTLLLIESKTHFEFISWHFHADGSGVKAAKLTHDLLKERKERVMRDIFLQQVKSRTFEIAGAAVAFLISYTVNVALQRRLRGG